MSSKISALPAVTSLASGDVLTCLAGGLNSKMTRDAMLSADTSPGIYFAGSSGGEISLGSDGEVSIISAGGHPLSLETGAGNIIDMDDTGGIQMVAGVGVFSLQSSVGGTTIVLDQSDQLTITCSSAAPIFITYHDSTTTVWASSKPPDILTAIVRIANAVRTLRGSAIP